MDAYKLETERGRKVERNKELRWYVEKQGWGMEVAGGFLTSVVGRLKCAWKEVGKKSWVRRGQKTTIFP